MKKTITSAAVIAALLIPTAAVPAQAAATSSTRATIIRVVDGDTVETTKGTIRLIGIDSPEMDTCEGQAATVKAMAYLPIGAKVTLTKVKKVGNKDKYGRSLRYIKYKGLDFGSRMIKAGYADARYDSRDGYKRHPFQTKYVKYDKKYADKVCPAPVAPAPAPVDPAPIIPVVPVLPPPSTGTDPRFDTCTAAIAAGFGPYYRATDVEYGWYIDRDADGVVCER